MEKLRTVRTPALIVLLLLLVSAGSIYFVSLLPSYNPYQLDERFTSLDPKVWEIGGMKNYSVSNGILTLFDSTNATHYFITNPKWQSPIPETRLQGSLEISFSAYALTNSSLVVATTDSWRAYVYNGMVEVDLNGTAGREGMHVQEVLSSGWHTLVAESGIGLLKMSLDGQTLAQVDSWDGNLTRVELGTGLPSIGALRVKGALLVNGVRADLWPLVESQTLLVPNGPTRGVIEGPQRLGSQADSWSYAAAWVLFSLSVVPEEAEGTDAASGSRGAGGGVVAIVYPIHAAMTRINATPRKAVTCSVIRGQPYTNQP